MQKQHFFLHIHQKYLLTDFPLIACVIIIVSFFVCVLLYRLIIVRVLRFLYFIQYRITLVYILGQIRKEQQQKK